MIWLASKNLRFFVVLIPFFLVVIMIWLYPKNLISSEQVMNEEFVSRDEPQLLALSERITDEKLILRSSLIITGVIQEIYADQGFVEVDVTENLKGVISGSIDVFFLTEPQRRFNLDWKKGEKVILCLEKKAEDFWLVPVSRAKITLSSPDDPQITLFKTYIDLSNKNEEQINDYLLENLTSDKWQERWSALNVINQTERKNYRLLYPAIIKALEDKNLEVKIAGVTVLGNKRIREGVSPLMQILKNQESQELTVETIMALGKIADLRAFEPLLNTLTDENPVIRQTAAFSLLYFEDERKTDPLIKATRDPVSRVRLAAVGSLGNLKRKEVIEALIERLSDQDEVVRQEAFRLLKMFTGKSFGYNPFDPLHFQDSINQWKIWWQQSKDSFEF